MSLRNRLRSMFHRGELDSDLENELKFHVEQKMLDLIATGMDPETARLTALRSFGGVEKLKEQCRDVRGARWFEHTWQDFRFGLRSLAKDRRFTGLAILALALAIGSATVIFSAIYGIILNTFPFPNADQVTSFGFADLNRPSGGDRETLSFDEFLFFRDHNHVFQDLSGEFGGFGSTPLTYSTGTSTYQFDADYLSANSFQFFGVQPLLGRLPSPDDVKPGAPAVFVIGDKLWARQFARDPRIVGQTFLLNGVQRTLVGIMPPRFRWAWVDAWVPFSLEPQTVRTDPDLARQYLYTVGRLKPGVTLQQAGADLEVVARQYAKIHPDAYPKQLKVIAQRLSDRVVGPFKQLVYPLMIAVALLVLIGCTNVANLLLARGTSREKEIAVRVSLGASRNRLVRQFLVESCVLAAAACLAGCALAWFGIRVLVPLVPYNAFPQEAVIQLNGHVLLFALGVTLLTTVLCGIVPAVRALKGDIQPRLSSSGKGSEIGFRHGKLRSALVVTEVALSIVLLAGAGMSVRAFWTLQHLDFGFNPSRILSLNLALPPGVKRTPLEMRATSQRVFERVENLPGVVSATVAFSVPPFGGPHSDITIPGKSHSEAWTSMLDLCSEGYFQTLDLHLLGGRLLSKNEVDSVSRFAVINQAFAEKYFGNDDPIGQNVAFNALDDKPGLKGALFQIVGVVSNIKNHGIKDATAPEAYIPYTTLDFGGSAFLVKTSMDPGALISTIRQAVWAVDSSVAVTKVETIDALLQRQVFAFPEFESAVIGAFAAIGLTLVIIGIFSVMAYTVSLQTRDIGVRMALGAQPGDILRMVLRNGMVLVWSGVAIGIGASLGFSKLAAHKIYGLPPGDVLTYGAVVLIVVAVGAAACLFPARRATRVDPLVALRYE